MDGSPDVIVIGGGIAGASVAYEIAAHRSVLLLEAEPSLAVHSTGRSAATYIPGHGTAVFRALIRASAPRFPALAEELEAPPFLRPLTVVWAAFDEAGERELQHLLAEWAAEPDGPHALAGAEAAGACPGLRDVRCGAITEAAADVDAIGLHGAYVRGLRRRGGRVVRGARARAITRTGGTWRVETAEGAWTAPDVVDAAGSWTDVVAALAGVTPAGLTPYRRTIALSPCTLPPGMPMLIDAAERFYCKPEGEALLLSPGDETPAEPGDARPDELDVALALERVEEALHLGLRSVRTAWAGLRTFAPDRDPLVGARPEHPGFHFFAGQGGSGIESAPALAALGAAVVTGTPVPPDVAVRPEQVSPARL
ncbi:NAD(P)/FAD-dependent oxidoreductase [Pseudonocardia sp. RS010]|uniref:NAD(P)/FAD-dependent oxidoreductase n=1 Tax=Pseudonocardia sp. RS010 TaxID=3385979 RepID=UPI0039A3E05B